MLVKVGANSSFKKKKIRQMLSLTLIISLSKNVSGDHAEVLCHSKTATYFGAQRILQFPPIFVNMFQM